MPLSWDFTVDKLPMNDRVDCVVHLPVQPGPGGNEWPAGTSATLKFYESPSDDDEILSVSGFVTTAAINFKIEAEVVATIPTNTYFEIIAALPDTPTTECPLYCGRTVKKSR